MLKRIFFIVVIPAFVGTAAGLLGVPPAGAIGISLGLGAAIDRSYQARQELKPNPWRIVLLYGALGGGAAFLMFGFLTGTLR